MGYPNPLRIVTDYFDEIAEEACSECCKENCRKNVDDCSIVGDYVKQRESDIENVQIEAALDSEQDAIDAREYNWLKMQEMPWG